MSLIDDISKQTKLIPDLQNIVLGYLVDVQKWVNLLNDLFLFIDEKGDTYTSGIMISSLKMLEELKILPPSDTENITKEEDEYIDIADQIDKDEFIRGLKNVQAFGGMFLNIKCRIESRDDKDEIKFISFIDQEETNLYNIITSLSLLYKGTTAPDISDNKSYFEKQPIPFIKSFHRDDQNGIRLTFLPEIYKYQGGTGGYSEK